MQSSPTTPPSSSRPSFEQYMVSPMSRRSRIQRACMACRRRKIKCNGNLDGCDHCITKELKCRYEPVPDDEKLKARSYKRQLIQRRQQTQVYWDTSVYQESMLFTPPFTPRPNYIKSMAAYPIGFYSPQNPALSSQHAVPHHMAQHGELLPSFFPTPGHSQGAMGRDVNPFFHSVTAPSSSYQLQNITGSCSYKQAISAPLLLELLPTLSLSSSMSSPTLSDSSSTGYSSSRVAEAPSQINTPLSATFPSSVNQHGYAVAQSPYHHLAGGLEIYHVSSKDAMISNSAGQLSLLDNCAVSTAPSLLSSPEEPLRPLPSSYGYPSVLESTDPPAFR